MKIFLPTSIFFCLLFSGCAQFTTAYRDFNIDDGSGAMIDVKQRAIITSTLPPKDNQSTGNRVVCAEPSPDALSAYASQIAAKNKETELTTATQESAASIGLRTQSIQLLRDSLYRLCEGYMSGALDRAQYEILVRRYQKYMIALLSIESLTGTVKAPPATINTQSYAEIAKSVSEMRAEMDSIDKKIKSLNSDINTLQAEKKADGTLDERKNEIDIKVKELEDKKQIYEADKSFITSTIENAKGMAVSGSANANISSVGIHNSRSDSHIQAVSNTVKEITKSVIESEDLGQLCFSFLRYDDQKQNIVEADKLKKIADLENELNNLYDQEDSLYTDYNKNRNSIRRLQEKIRIKNTLLRELYKKNSKSLLIEKCDDFFQVYIRSKEIIDQFRRRKLDLIEQRIKNLATSGKNKQEEIAKIEEVINDEIKAIENQSSTSETLLGF